ncbi:LLM class flavin-dependent oxidoreductase [Micromonospora sp. b486]|uniref:LLM class flavin-dependent oxidoreductase n=1 Tax=Micromonospora sp. b486 TaxID=3053986 RepID=UPI00259CC2D2|nr:LLM class flavin-dependent oxidoreductase [Micromonospora sp. b486]MDM4784586.1 LLM class flavin-dependent oxidoreductase [Micromonospora sp. b486]
MARMSAGAEGRLEVYPNVWAGYGLLRPGAGAALVGSHEQVADRIAELHGLGVEHLLLSGQPHLEEAYCSARACCRCCASAASWRRPTDDGGGEP